MRLPDLPAFLCLDQRAPPDPLLRRRTTLQRHICAIVPAHCVIGHRTRLTLGFQGMEVRLSEFIVRILALHFSKQWLKGLKFSITKKAENQ
jgi:hypothetical protein